MLMIKVAPSILAADFSVLREEIKSVEPFSDYLHIDVMDGHFVPNISIGPAVVASLRPHSQLIFDVHLMVENPKEYIDVFIGAGADLITVHAEAETDVAGCIKIIKDRGKLAGISVKPKTPLSVCEPYLNEVDLMLIMTVEPGFGGQPFIMGTLPKIAEARTKYPLLDIEVDGGINADNACLAAGAGANILVSGSAVFDAVSRGAVIGALRGC